MDEYKITDIKRTSEFDDHGVAMYTMTAKFVRTLPEPSANLAEGDQG